MLDGIVIEWPYTLYVDHLHCEIHCMDSLCFLQATLWTLWLDNLQSRRSPAIRPVPPQSLQSFINYPGDFKSFKAI